MDRCQPGTTTEQCGRSGATCGGCATGQSCVAQGCGVAVVGGGGDAGGAGDAGPRADAGVTCLQIGPVTQFDEAAFEGPPDAAVLWSVFGTLPYDAGAGTDSFLQVELYRDPSDLPTFPETLMVPAETYAECFDCFTVNLGCEEVAGSSVCEASFLAQGGALSFIAGTANERAGRFAGSASNLKFQEWDFDEDKAVVGGRCLVISQANWDEQWDAGPLPVIDGGSTSDAGRLPDGGLRDGG